MDNEKIPGLEEFVEEADEILLDLEEGVLLFENQPKKRSLIDRIFRNMHTLKGGAGMVMQPEMANYAHHFENLLDKVRNGEIVCTPVMTTLLLDSLDGFRSYLDQIRGTGEVNQELVKQSLKGIAEFESKPSSSGKPPPELKKVNKVDEPDSLEKEIVKEENLERASNGSKEKSDFSKLEWDDEEEEEKGYLLSLKFNQEMFLKGGDPMLLLKELNELGELTIIPHLGSLPGLKSLEPDQLHLWWSAKLVTTRPVEDLEDILVFFQAEHDVNFEPVESPPPDPGFIFFDTELAEKNETIDFETVKVKANVEAEGKITENPKQIESVPVQKKAASKIEAIKKETFVKEPDKEPEFQTVQSIRVAVDKLDRLQNLVGETVINQSRLNQLTEQILGVDENLGEMLMQFVEDNEKSVRELQDQILQVRMIPVGSIFTPMKRNVRDFANRSNKKIRLEIEGGDTELDKTVTEQLHGPLVHLVRNSMDHGIEDPQIREELGKDQIGTILLKADHQEGYVIVEIEDDGRGIDTKMIYESALRKQLINASDELDEQAIFQLLFLPGFTTTKEVTDVSGRGVGMDTVKRDIEALLGTIQISSSPGMGTNVKLKLPLTLAIIEGMMIEVGNEVFTLPLLSVNEALRPVSKQVKKIKNKGELVEIRGEYIPLLRLHDRLKLKPRYTDPTKGLVLVVQHANRKQCLLVDEIIDQRPVVIKSMEDNFIQIPGIAGATILGNGNVSFILDVPSLVN